MDPQQIKAFIDAMAASDLDEMEVGHEGWTLRLVRRGGGAPAAAAPAPQLANAAPAVLAEASVPQAPVAAAPAHEVRAPMFGVVHLQQAPGEPPFVRPGDRIEAGQLLCTIEAMKVFNEVHAEHAGRVAAVLVATGAEVEAGQALLRIERGDHV